MGTGSGGGEGRGRAGKGLAMKAGVEERKGRGDVPGTMSSISSRAAEVESQLFTVQRCAAALPRERQGNSKVLNGLSTGSIQSTCERPRGAMLRSAPNLQPSKSVGSAFPSDRSGTQDVRSLVADLRLLGVLVDKARWVVQPRSR